MGLFKSLKNIAHKIGLTKKNLQKVTPIISAINPVAGIVAGAATGGMEGAKNAILGTVMGNLASGGGIKNLFNFAAKHNIPSLTQALKNTFKDTRHLLTNTMLSGGDVKKGLLLTLAQQYPGLSQYSNAISGILGNIPGLDLSKFGIQDMAGLYSMVKYITSKPPEPPQAPAFESMTPDKINDIVNSYEGILDRKTQETLHNIRDQYNARGMLRSGFELNQERKAQEDAARQLANYKANLNTQALEYNNQLKQNQFNNALQQYAIQAHLDEQQKQALADMATAYVNTHGGDLMSALSNVLGGVIAPSTTSSTTTTVPTGATPPINPNTSSDNLPPIPDINLQDQINQNQTNYQNTQLPNYQNNNLYKNSQGMLSVKGFAPPHKEYTRPQHIINQNTNTIANKNNKRSGWKVAHTQAWAQHRQNEIDKLKQIYNDPNSTEAQKELAKYKLDDLEGRNFRPGEDSIHHMWRKIADIRRLTDKVNGVDYQHFPQNIGGGMIGALTQAYNNMIAKQKANLPTTNTASDLTNDDENFLNSLQSARLASLKNSPVSSLMNQGISSIPYIQQAAILNNPSFNHQQVQDIRNDVNKHGGIQGYIDYLNQPKPPIMKNPINKYSSFLKQYRKV